MADIHKLLEIVVRRGASDLHLAAGAPPVLRLDGEISPMDRVPLSGEEVQSLLFEILSEKQKKKFIEEWELDLGYEAAGLARFRVNIFMQRRGLGAVFRQIPVEVKSARELGLPESIYNLINVQRGLVLVGGATGSGKSTTMATLVDYINASRRGHIITVEDPVEFVHESKKCLINQREVSSHTKSFANALRAALREDPDVILVGEMRDLETIELALTAAETGHLVFATIHTSFAVGSIERIIDAFPSDQQSQIRTMLSECLRGVISQALFKRIDRPGRIAGMEMLFVDSAVSNLIREGKTHQIASLMQTGMEKGMMTYERHIGTLVDRRVVDRGLAEQFLGKALKQDHTSSRNGNASQRGGMQARPNGLFNKKIG